MKENFTKLADRLAKVRSEVKKGVVGGGGGDRGGNVFDE